MLDKIISQLNGKAADHDTLAARLLQLGTDREETRANIDSLQKQRHQLLLADASDADLDKIERQIDRAETRLEKLNLAEPGIRERIVAAKAAARQQRWRELFDAYLATAADFLVAARATAAKHEALLSIVARAQGEGLANNVAASMPITPNISGSALCAPDLLDAFENGLKPPAPAAKRPRLGKAEAWWNPADSAYDSPTSKNLRELTPKPKPGLSHAIQLRGGIEISRAEAPPRDSPGKPDLTPLLPGQARVKVLRAGYSPADDQPQCNFGQVIRMRGSTAERVAAAGVVEIIETYLAPAAGEVSADKPVDAASTNT